MNKKMFGKIFITVVIVFVLGMFIKHNVKVVETKVEGKKSMSSLELELDINSEVVQKLYNDLNVDLINKNCDMKTCLISDNYSFLYFNFDEKEKVLNDVEKLYLVFNYLYSKKSFSENINEDGNKELTINKEDVENELIKRFGNVNLKEFDNNFAISNGCGIISYTFTGNTYDLIVNECESIYKLGFSKLVFAKKDGNFIKLKIKSFYAETDANDFSKDEKVYDIKNYNNDVPLAKASYNELYTNDDIFDDYEFNNYEFTFELSGDDYYLKDIKK